MAKSLKAGEKTGPQVAAIVAYSGVLPSTLPVTYATYRTIRKDPTIALARALIHAAVICGKWSVECDDEVDDEVVQEINDSVVRFRTAIATHMLYGSIDFGWAGFELVYAMGDDGRVYLSNAKTLLQDLTTILVEKDTGAFAGYRQKDQTGNQVDIPVEYALHFSPRAEGTNWYGEPLLENARATVTKWDDADASASRYDKKVAGSHFVIKYPIGTSLYLGVDTNNCEIAKALLTALEGSGSIVVPDQVQEFISAENKDGPKWSIDILEDTGNRQPSFVDRLKYLDALKVRALLVPERAVLEGDFGTKAEAGVHASMAIRSLQALDQLMADAVNEQLVNRLLAANYGPDATDTVRVVPAPLDEEQISYIRKIYDAVLSNPSGFLEEFEQIDTDAMKDQLGVPKRQEVAQAGDEIPDDKVPAVNPEGPSPEQLSLMAQFTASGRGGKLSYSSSGLAGAFGPELAAADEAFRTAMVLSKAGRFDSARGLLASIKRPSNDKAHYAVQRKIGQALDAILRAEMRRDSRR